jgi:hypothetical protein
MNESHLRDRNTYSTQIATHIIDEIKDNKVDYGV